MPDKLVPISKIATMVLEWSCMEEMIISNLVLAYKKSLFCISSKELSATSKI